MKVLISGAQGMLGWELTDYFSQFSRKDPVIALGKEDFDITSPSSVEKALEAHQPEILINCAAYTNVDGAETEREKAEALNIKGPQILAAFCHRSKTKMVHFSTDQVFDGTATEPVKESAGVAPLNYYAQTKYQGEQAVLAYPEHLVLRVQWLYGKRKDRFTPLRTKRVFTPFADQFGAPTWTKHICEVLFEMLHRNAVGLFHFSYDDYASWAQVFAFAVKEMNLDVELTPKKSEEFALPAKRPSFSVMSNEKLLSFLGRDKIGSWKDALREFLRTVNPAPT